MPKHFSVELITFTGGKSGDKTIDTTHIFCTKNVLNSHRKKERSEERNMFRKYALTSCDKGCCSSTLTSLEQLMFTLH